MREIGEREGGRDTCVDRQPDSREDEAAAR